MASEKRRELSIHKMWPGQPLSQPESEGRLSPTPEQAQAREWSACLSTWICWLIFVQGWHVQEVKHMVRFAPLLPSPVVAVARLNI